MLHIKADGSREAWLRTLRSLFYEARPTDNAKYYRDEPVTIDINTPSLEPSHPLFPMRQRDLDIINRYIYSGEKEDEVVHEWTKLYYHRIFGEPHSQMEYLLRLLQSDVPKGACQISLWDKAVDQDAEISPCTLVIWARRREEKVDLHVHAHSSDAYKKLLMNLQEFISLHHYIAQASGLSPGKYLHFIDSCHIRSEDVEIVAEVFEQTSSCVSNPRRALREGK